MKPNPIFKHLLIFAYCVFRFRLKLSEYSISCYFRKMDLKQRFQQDFPSAFFLNEDVQAVNSYLLQQDWFAEKESLVSLEKPGSGNMNFVLRATTNQRSFILKQARPWVEKFPQIEAPVERISVEAQFFQQLEKIDVIKNFIPKYLGFDVSNFILATEDLGKGADYSFLYESGEFLQESDADNLSKFLSELHQTKISEGFPVNMSMRELNHEHIFNFPYLEENGFNLDDVQPGLQLASMPYKTDSLLKETIAKCGKVYLSAGKYLLHGDFYPGSWLKVEDGLKVIDPEFGFVGPVEFDLAVFVAHLFMAEQKATIIDQVLQNYERPKDFDSGLLAQFAGIEILRRLIGVAQLPLSLDLAKKEQLMEQAASWIMSKDISF